MLNSSIQMISEDVLIEELTKDIGDVTMEANNYRLHFSSAGMVIDIIDNNQIISSKAVAWIEMSLDNVRQWLSLASPEQSYQLVEPVTQRSGNLVVNGR